MVNESNTTFWYKCSVEVGDWGEYYCEEDTPGRGASTFNRASTEHDVVHDLREIPSHRRRPDPVGLREADPTGLGLFIRYLQYKVFFTWSCFSPPWKRNEREVGSSQGPT